METGCFQVRLSVNVESGCKLFIFILELVVTEHSDWTRGNRLAALALAADFACCGKSKGSFLTYIYKHIFTGAFITIIYYT